MRDLTPGACSCSAASAWSVLGVCWFVILRRSYLYWMKRESETRVGNQSAVCQERARLVSGTEQPSIRARKHVLIIPSNPWSALAGATQCHNKAALGWYQEHSHKTASELLRLFGVGALRQHLSNKAGQTWKHHVRQLL